MQDGEMATLVKAQRDSLRKTLDRYGKWGLKPTAVLIAAIGVIILIVWAATKDSSVTSMLMLLTGTSVIIIAIIMYFLSPSRHIRCEVSDAMVLSGIENLDRILSSLYVGSRGIYMPAGPNGTTRVFLPISDGHQPVEIGDMTATSGSIFNVSGNRINGIVINPPGQGLMAYARSIGALFTPDELEDEMKDLLENGLELVSKVNVRVDGDIVYVTLKKIANADMCASIRADRQAICEQIGCPVCSFITCMVVDGMNRAAVIRSIDRDGDTLNIKIELIGE